ncbi:MAG: YheC/YheD family endospore coat-associated protein [Tumebacillaceae bacterium]
MERKDIVYIGVKQNDARDPWYLSISEAARQQAKLPYQRKLRVRMSQHGTPLFLPVAQEGQGDTLVPVRVQKNKQGIVLGPIVGILTVLRKGTNSFRGNRANFRDIIEMGRRLGMTVVVCTPEGLSGDDRMEGWVLTESQKPEWKSVVLPLPSVVYNRVPDREAEQSSAVVQVKKRLAEHGIPLFNPQFFDKGQMFQWVHSERETASHVPHTETLEGEQQIAKLLRQHSLLYVKPADGKAGDGIIQIRKTGQGYRVVAQAHGKRVRAQFATRQQVASAVWRKTQGRSYLLQQGISLASYSGRRFDLRLLVQKNRNGAWRVTGVGARVADRDGITTHVPNGGEIERATLALRSAFGRQRGNAILQEVRQMALTFAQTIEQQAGKSGQVIGEMSMDIGVGADGSLWFFEANAKPMKFDEPYIRAKSLLRLLHYCDFLARVQ